MKTVKDKTGNIRRISKEEAETLKALWEFIPKHAWKEQVRDVLDKKRKKKNK